MVKKIDNNKFIIGIIGLGYVGLPLAVEFSKYFEVIGYDKDLSRIDKLSKGIDLNLEINKNVLKKTKLFFTSNYKQLAKCNIYIITVPTPILKNKKPNLNMIKDATKMITKIIKPSNIVVLESTVYPGVTENIVGGIIKKTLNYKLNKDFYLGYSPERINPGDSKNTLPNIKKIISGSNRYSTNILNKIYSKIIKKGIHKCESIRIAESAKVIENVQRDVNIALMNEFETIFDKLNINSKKIFDAAYTKWNFLKFSPGLVGGHCIGVDPYYLIDVARKNNYAPKIIINSRKINDNIPKNISKKINNALKFKNNTKNILLLGATFKENCPDIRNSKVFDLYKILKKNYKVSVYEPVANREDIRKIYKRSATFKINKKYDAILFLVPHRVFITLGYKNFIKYLNKGGLFFDYKYKFNDKQFSYKE